MQILFSKLLWDDEKICASEENVEVVCIFLKTIGKELDESSMISKQSNDLHFRRLKNLSNHPQMRVRCMIQNIIDLRSNRWVSAPEVVLVYDLSKKN
ncbi:unnamed protein product [Thlaspi arvense]|uniref:MIF4G domain-containing protein n=1 Tax=Thlaspi arvense TaxID=13288 RepID=A0AAU9RRJ6_THLAR|nr:unnamed protein product [Thlaspi arvense]